MKVKEQIWVEDDEMALCPPAKPAFEGVSEGTHVAICNMVADLGIQNSPFGAKHQIYVRFEVPAERCSYQDDDGKDQEGPRMIGKHYGFSMHEKSNLRQHLESWRGRTFADSELMNDNGDALYDVTNIVGQPCQISVVKNDKGASMIKSIIGLPKGFPVPKLETESIIYDGDNLNNLPKLPKWMREKVSSEPQQSQSKDHANQSLPLQNSATLGDEELYNDDIPF